MIEEAAAVEAGGSPAESPLVAVSFQRNIHRTKKYLEAEPKALGITQIGLSVFQIIGVAVFVSKDLLSEHFVIPFFILSLLPIIAGSLAIAAQNLHLPTLRACFGMQIVASAASLFNMISDFYMMDAAYMCYGYDYYHNSTEHYDALCQKIESSMTQLHTGEVLIEVALLAISLTLAVYCGKVINCCFPAPKMPVITVQAPPVQQ